MIKAIVFDFGNVISEPHDELVYARQASLAGMDEAFFRAAFWKYRPAFDGGSLTGREMYRRVLAEAGVTGTDAALGDLADRLLDEDMASWARISRDVTEWGLSLQEAGYTLGILSNMPWDFLNRYRTQIELFARADVPVFSCEVGLVKPDPEIYRLLIERLGCAPGEIVFFDDLDPNVRAARECGIDARLWTGLEAAKRDWAEAISR